jgi:hypothetical protein
MAGCLGGGTAAAQVQRGSSELSGRANFDAGKTSLQEDRDVRFEFGGYYGFFLSDRWEIGTSLALIKGTGIDATGAAGLFTDFHFGDTSLPIVPFAEGSIGFGFGDPRDNPLILGVLAGVKYFVASGGGAVVAGPYYRYLRYDREVPGYGAVHELGVSVSLAMYF